jgi:inner membrane protein
MDTITHTLFGLTTYAAIDKTDKSQAVKRSLLVSSLIGSQIPDSDVVLNLTETGRMMEQMWHRGLTHSYFIAPIWAMIIYFICYLIWKKKDKIIFYAAFINVLLHISFDTFNTWGTGIVEPLSSMRASLGIIPIIDFVILTILLVPFIFSRFKKYKSRHRIWRVAWLLIAIHVGLQAVQGFIIYENAKSNYEQVALSADFIPWHYSVIGKTGEVVEIYKTTVWGTQGEKEVLLSNEQADLEPLFKENPKAEVLVAWSPFVVVVDDEEKLGVFDPRFYRGGESFLFEYIEKQK